MGSVNGTQLRRGCRSFSQAAAEVLAQHLRERDSILEPERSGSKTAAGCPKVERSESMRAANLGATPLSQAGRQRKDKEHPPAKAAPTMQACAVHLYHRSPGAAAFL